jgi:SRSO17 transposase
MTLLDHPEARALLADAVLSSDQLAELADRFEPFLQRYLPLFQRAEQREHVRHLLLGKLSNLSRKTCEPIAHLFQIRRESLQDFVGVSPWRDDRLLEQLRQHVSELWGDPQGVLIGDGSGFAKKGSHSCGVKRQYCGRQGKVDNCQIGIFLAYACRHGQTLLDHRLFLPAEWAADPVRRKKTGVPAAVVYQESWQILLEALDRGRAVPHAWFVADAEFGRVNLFRAGLRKRKERYVVDVRSDLRIRDLRQAPPPRQGTTGRFRVVPTTSASAWAALQPASAWRPFTIRDGDQGPLRVEALETWVRTFENNTRLGPEERLVVIRTVDDQEPKTWYALSNAGAAVPLAEVVGAHGQRYWTEASFHDGKSEVGLDEYEVRGWVGWHHHMTLSLLALWFLASERTYVQKKRQR